MYLSTEIKPTFFFIVGKYIVVLNNIEFKESIDDLKLLISLFGSENKFSSKRLQISKLHIIKNDKRVLNF